jgi:hypothetical protein
MLNHNSSASIYALLVVGKHGVWQLCHSNKQQQPTFSSGLVTACSQQCMYASALA